MKWLDKYGETPKAQRGKTIITDERQLGNTIKDNIQPYSLKRKDTVPLTKEQIAQRKAEEIKARQGEIRQHTPQSTMSKAKEIALNPMTAFGYVARNEQLPENFSKGNRVGLDYAIDVVNPVQYVEDTKNVVQGAYRGDLGQVGEGLLGVVPMGLEAKNIYKGIKNIPTGIAPELQEGLQTAGISDLYKINPWATKIDDAATKVVGEGKNSFIYDPSKPRYHRTYKANPNFLTGYKQIKKPNQLDFSPIIDTRTEEFKNKALQNFKTLTGGKGDDINLEQFVDYFKSKQERQHLKWEYQDFLTNINREKFYDTPEWKNVWHDSIDQVEDIFGKIEETLEQKSSPLGKRLGSGAEGSVYELAADPNKVIKIGNTFKTSSAEDLVKSFEGITDDNIARVLRAHQDNKHLIEIMPNLKANAKFSNFTKEQVLGKLEKDAKGLMDRGFYLDVDNIDGNFKYNPDKNKVDIYDISKPAAGQTSQNPEAVLRILKNHFSNDFRIPKTHPSYNPNMPSPEFKGGGNIKKAPQLQHGGNTDSTAMQGSKQTITPIYQFGGNIPMSTWETQQAKVKAEKDIQLQKLLKDKSYIKNLEKESANRRSQVPSEQYITINDVTNVPLQNKPEKTSVAARNKTNKEIAQERQARIDAQTQANAQPFDWGNFRQSLADRSQATGDVFRAYNEPNFFDDYLNPAAMLGSMADNLGQAPLRAQQEDSYMPYLTAIGTPLAVGALAGVGTNGSKIQFVNNLVNPLAGIKNPFKTPQIDLSNSAGKMYGEHPTIVQAERLKNKNIKNKYFKYKDYDQPIKENFTDKIKDKGTDINIYNYENFIDDIHNQTAFGEASYFNKSPQNLGSGSFRHKGNIFTDAPLDTQGKAIIEAHEKNHGVFAGTLREDVIKDLKSAFNSSGPIKGYKDTHQADEILARMAQFKNALGFSNNQVFTKGHLDLIRKNYPKEFVDNGITDMLEKIPKNSSYEKKFIQNMNKYAFGIAPIAGATYMTSQQNSSFKNGGVIKDDMGYWNPDNVGKTVEIGSGNITMEGVNQPLLGISKQTGEEKIMFPGKNYSFSKTKQVIEYPLIKWLDKY